MWNQPVLTIRSQPWQKWASVRQRSARVRYLWKFNIGELSELISSSDISLVTVNGFYIGCGFASSFSPWNADNFGITHESPKCEGTGPWGRTSFKAPWVRVGKNTASLYHKTSVRQRSAGVRISVEVQHISDGISPVTVNELYIDCGFASSFGPWNADDFG